MKKKNAYILGGSALLGVGLYMFGKGTLKQKLAEAVISGDTQTAQAIVNKTQKKKTFKEIIDISKAMAENYKIVELNGEQVAVPVANEEYWKENLEGEYEPTIWSAVKEGLSAVFGKISGR